MVSGVQMSSVSVVKSEDLAQVGMVRIGHMRTLGF